MALTQVQGGMLAGSTNTTTTIQSNGTTAITVDSTQNVGIGITNQDTKLGVDGRIALSNDLVFAGSATNATRKAFLTYNAGGNNGSLVLGADPDNLLASSFMRFDVDGTQRMNINSNGTISVSANASGDQAAYINNSSANPYGIQCTFLGATPNNTTNTFFIGADSTNSKIIIYSSGTITNRTGTYNAFSDAKLKENIVDATPKLNKLMDVKVRNYNLIGDELKQIGFVAQELEQVFPSLIDNVPDLDEDKNPTGEVTKGVKLTVMIPILVKAIQELNAKVEAQAAEIAALKAAP